MVGVFVHAWVVGVHFSADFDLPYVGRFRILGCEIPNARGGLMPAELRLIRRGGYIHGFKDGARQGFRAKTILEIWSHYYQKPNVTEVATFLTVEAHLHEGMCLWLYGNRGWWFSRIGAVEFIGIDNIHEAANFRDYSVGASRVNWTDAIARMSYEYEETTWWRDIHNAGTGV